MNGDDLANPVKYLGGEEACISGGLTKRELIAAMAMQGLLANPGMAHAISCGSIAKMASSEADNLIHYLSVDPVAEGLNLVPIYDRELDEGLNDGN